MPLGRTEGYVNRANFIGVETEYDPHISRVVDFNSSAGVFDFVVAPLMHPDYRPSLMPNFPLGTFDQSEPFIETETSMKASSWNTQVAGKISTWIDLDSEDETLRMESEIVLKKEIHFASYLCLKGCLLPAPKGTSCANYARCVNQIFHSVERRSSMKLWLRIPLEKTDDDSLVDSWKAWNSFRQLCEHHNHLWVVLDNLVSQPSDNSLSRWYGEPVAAVIIHTDSFLSNTSGFLKYLPMDFQKLITDLFDHSIQIIISTEPVPTQGVVKDPYDSHSHADLHKHPLEPYRDYIALLYQRMDPLTKQERVQFCIRDVLQKPPDPLKRNIEAYAYLKIEKDTTKYELYKKAICQALLDRVPDEKVSEITTVLAVAGAGHGSLVKTSVQAAKETGRMLKVYAVEKNPNAINSLNGIIMTEDMRNIVTIVPSDVRCWNAPERVDILVSELLGSFGDNGLSPEWLDGVHRFLKEDGISIPSSYTSFLQPVTASKLYNSVKAEEDILRLESAFVVKMHNVTQLAACQPVFTFTHPKQSDEECYQRHKKLLFVIPDDTEAAMVHGFAGYFDATLYKDVHIGTEPSTATPTMLTWYPMFFPLRTPLSVHCGSTLEVHFWRCCDMAKVWYEWCVSSPSISPIYNSNGWAFKLEL